METPQLSSLYQQLILEHYRNPRNKAELEEKTVEIHMANPVCGDEVRLQLRIEGDQIAEAKFVGHGCSISQAAISMMTAKIQGASLSDARTSSPSKIATNSLTPCDPARRASECCQGFQALDECLPSLPARRAAENHRSTSRWQNLAPCFRIRSRDSVLNNGFS